MKYLLFILFLSTSYTQMLPPPPPIIDGIRNPMKDYSLPKIDAAGNIMQEATKDPLDKSDWLIKKEKSQVKIWWNNKWIGDGDRIDNFIIDSIDIYGMDLRNGKEKKKILFMPKLNDTKESK